MRATAVTLTVTFFFNVVDLYDSGTGRWSTAQLSEARYGLSATSVGTVAIFAGGQCGKLLRIVFVSCVRDCHSVTVDFGYMIAVVRCVMATWVFVFRAGVGERLLSYARHCR
jgi:hypothetical protein